MENCKLATIEVAPRSWQYCNELTLKQLRLEAEYLPLIAGCPSLWTKSKRFHGYSLFQIGWDELLFLVVQPLYTT